MNSSAAETLGLSRVSWVGLVMDGNASAAILRQFNVTQEDLSALQALINSSSKYEMTHCYCSGTLREFLVGYRAWHGYLSLVVCVFGTVANALNVAVLTRKEMVSAPINRILTALAVADMLVMLEYMPFAIYQYLVSPDQDMPYRGAVFVLFHSHFTQVLHTISICLTLALAIWRYIAIR
ncbi:hypothetical protein C0J52_12487 [Blattella germanica]|nr:hypothetical protein C0J52_12487 [Blattella germanica]